MQLGVPTLVIIYYILWVCVPMVPAVLIYALFPKQPIGVRGPLGALTISATGAFAGYVIVFALAYPMVQQGEKILSSMIHPIWKISAKVKLVNEDGTDANPDWLRGLVVELHPDIYTTANELVSIYVPEINGSLPNIVLRVPKFGSNVIDASDQKPYIDEYKKEMNLDAPIVIKKTPVRSDGIASTNSLW